MTSRYIRRPPIDTTPAPCHPSKRMDACYVCSRWRIAPEIPAEERQFVVIDASTIAVNGSCAMFEARPAVRAYCEVEA